MRRGQATANLGDFDSGLRDVRRAIEMNAKNGDYYEALALLQLDTGNVADAAAAMDKAGKLDASHGSGAAVIVYYLAGKLDRAEAAIATGIGSDPSYPYWPIWRALVQRAGGDQGGALQTLDQGLRLGPQWPAPVMQFLAGKITESKLRALANSGDQKTRAERLCEVEFYRGESAYLAGAKATAKSAMQAATGARIYYYLEDAGARARLAQLNQ
jgi:lipoprotein NlpI